MPCPVCDGTGRVTARPWFPNNEKFEHGVRWYGPARPETCGHCRGTGTPPSRRPVSPEAARSALRMMSRFLRVTGGGIDLCTLERQLAEHDELVKSSDAGSGGGGPGGNEAAGPRSLSDGGRHV